MSSKVDKVLIQALTGAPRRVYACATTPERSPSTRRRDQQQRKSREVRNHGALSSLPVRLWRSAGRKPPGVGATGLRVLGLSLVSGVTAMSTRDHCLIQRHSNFAFNEKIHLLKQPWRGRVVGGLGGAGD
jgi:hypothetical protein